jgi:hypothetical protein
MLDLYFLAKSKGVNRLQLTLLRSIIDRFTASTLDLKVFTKILKELPHSEEATVSHATTYILPYQKLIQFEVAPIDELVQTS